MSKDTVSDLQLFLIHSILSYRRKREQKRSSIRSALFRRELIGCLQAKGLDSYPGGPCV